MFLLPSPAKPLAVLMALWTSLSLSTCHSVARKNALIIIDVQNCFLAGGTLAVKGGNDIVPVINSLRKKFSGQFSFVVLTQDWHCPDHVSFASQHPGISPYTEVQLSYNNEGDLCAQPNLTSPYSVQCGSTDVDHVITQTLWPDHCIINTTDADVSGLLHVAPTDVIVRKGYRCQVDSYSGFYDNGGFSQTELHSTLQKHNITDVYITGLALDFCVYYTSMDAIKLGYKVYTILDAAEAIGEDTKAKAMAKMKQAGVKLIMSSELGDYLVAGSWTRDPSSSLFISTLLITLIHLYKVL